MKYLYNFIACFLLMLTLSNNVFAQQVQADSTKTTKDNYVVIKNDADLIDEIISSNGKEALIITRGTGEIYINKPIIKEKKFISGEEKE